LGVMTLRQKFVATGSMGIAEPDGIGDPVGVTEDGVDVIDESLNADDMVDDDAIEDEV
jgi:hypothetical protein